MSRQAGLEQSLLRNAHEVIIEINDHKVTEVQLRNLLGKFERRLNHRLEEKSISSDFLDVVSNWAEEDIESIQREFLKKYTNAQIRQVIVWVSISIGVIASMGLGAVMATKLNDGVDQYLKFLVSSVALVALSCSGRCLFEFKYFNTDAVADEFLDELYRSTPKKQKERVVSFFKTRPEILPYDLAKVIGNYIYSSK